MKSIGIFGPLFYWPLKHIYKLFFDSEYRRYSWLVARYGSTPRYRQLQIRVHGWSLIVPDVASFLSAYKEIFVEEIYAFKTDNMSPVILDCGANVGLSALYFKKKYPEAKVIAYEADPEICKILEKNIIDNGITDVEIINKTIWSTETLIEFSVEGADAGRIDTGSDKKIIKIPTVSLQSIIKDTHFDLVKIDIEGAEFEVIKGSDSLLKYSKFVFVEYHSFSERKQDLGQLIRLFENGGFRCHIHSAYTSNSPFLGVHEDFGMDMRLNLFFWKDQK